MFHYCISNAIAKLFIVNSLHCNYRVRQKVSLVIFVCQPILIFFGAYTLGL